MELVGYARVSTREERQVFDRQMDALKASGCTRIFEDRGSGASSDRPGLRACTDYLRRDDVLVVLDLDRLGLVVTPVPKVPFWKFRNFNVLQPNLVITS